MLVGVWCFRPRSRLSKNTLCVRATTGLIAGPWTPASLSLCSVQVGKDVIGLGISYVFPIIAMQDSESWGRKDLNRIVRFCVDLSMCLMALGGLTSIAVDIASFRLGEIKLSLFGQPVTTTMQRLTLVGSHCALSVLGILYMLWRHNWHCRLQTLLKITAYCCVLVAAASALPQGVVPIMIAIASIGIFNFVYAFIWSCRITGSEDVKRAKKKKQRDGSQAL